MPPLVLNDIMRCRHSRSSSYDPNDSGVHRTSSSSLCWVQAARGALGRLISAAESCSSAFNFIPRGHDSTLSPSVLLCLSNRKGIAKEQEAAEYLSAGEMCVLPQLAVQSLQEHLICHLANVHAGVVQDGNDPFVLLLHQVHNHLVVKVIDLEKPGAEG